MTVQYRDNYTITMTGGTALAKYRLVKLTGDNTVGYSGPGDVPLGVTRVASIISDTVGVVLLNKDGTQIMVASGAISQNAVVYPAADGKVTATVTGRPIGRWISAAATTDGDQGEVICQTGDAFAGDLAGLLVVQDDFVSIDITDGPFDVTADASSTGGQTIADVAGGVLALYTDGDDNDEAYVHTISAPFLFAANKPLYMEARCALVEGATNAGAFLIGLVSGAAADSLVDTEAGPKANYSGVSIWKVAGGLTLSAEVSVGTTQTAIALSGTGVTYTSGTYYRFGIEFIPTSSTAATINIYIDGTLVGTTSFTFTGAAQMRAIVGAKSNGSAEELVNVDYVRVSQVR